MNVLAARLGLSNELTFYDVFSLTDPDLISLIPRPVYALLVIIPLTPSWNESRIKEDAEKTEYADSGPNGTSSFIPKPGTR
jgi:ubiquitin carboxyl-terminal hydrolase L3